MNIFLLNFIPLLHLFLLSEKNCFLKVKFVYSRIFLHFDQFRFPLTKSPDPNKNNLRSLVINSYFIHHFIFNPIRIIELENNLLLFAQVVINFTKLQFISLIYYFLLKYLVIPPP